MRVYNGSGINIYFGNAADQLFASQYQNLGASCDLISTEPFCQLKDPLKINKLYFLKQVHGTMGLAITPENKDAIPPFTIEGDYLVTGIPGTAIGVMTADCLPIVAIDQKHKAAGIAHAGWRGSVNGVGKEMINHMHTQYGTQPEDLSIFFGSSAHNCCYMVGDDLITHIEKTPHAPKFFTRTKMLFILICPSLINYNCKNWVFQKVPLIMIMLPVLLIIMPITHTGAREPAQDGK